MIQFGITFIIAFIGMTILVMVMLGAWNKGTFNNWAAGIAIFFVLLLLIGIIALAS